MLKTTKITVYFKYLTKDMFEIFMCIVTQFRIIICTPIICRNIHLVVIRQSRESNMIIFRIRLVYRDINNIKKIIIAPICPLEKRPVLGAITTKYMLLLMSCFSCYLILKYCNSLSHCPKIIFF